MYQIRSFPNCAKHSKIQTNNPPGYFKQGLTNENVYYSKSIKWPKVLWIPLDLYNINAIIHFCIIPVLQKYNILKIAGMPK